MENEKKGKKVTHSYHQNGILKMGTRYDDTSKYAPVTPREKHKPMTAQCKDGLTKNGKQQLQDALFMLKAVGGIDAMRWLIITYSDESMNRISSHEIINIAKSMSEVCRDLKYYLKSTFDWEWVVNIGLQNDTSHKLLLPCYDINIALIDDNDKKVEYFADTIYKCLSKVAGKIIEPSPYFREIYNKNEDFGQWVNYFTNQTESSLLYKLRQKHSDEYFPKTWGFPSTGLKKVSQPLKGEFNGSSLKVWQTIIKNDLQSVLQFLPNYSDRQKLIARMHPDKTPSEVKHICEQLWDDYQKDI